METREFIGGFVMCLYDNGLVTNRGVPRNVVKRNFQKYSQKYKTPEEFTTLDELLKVFNFLHGTAEKYYRFNFGSLHRYRNELIRQLDEEVIRSTQLNLQTNETRKVVANSEECSLAFHLNAIKISDKPFIVTSEGRYCYQENLKTEDRKRRAKLEIKGKLPDYLPSAVAKNISLYGFEENLHSIKNCVRNYLSKRTPLNKENICDVFSLLLQMEDYEISKSYEQLKKFQVKIDREKKSSLHYSMKMTSNKVNQNFEQILSVGDQIILSEMNSATTEYRGMINDMVGKRIYFETKGREIPVETLYYVIFEPRRSNIIYQHQALEFLSDDNNLRERLFPEVVESKNEQTEVRLTALNPRISTIPEQMQAVQHIANNHIRKIPFVIFGPPGTGKTTVVVESILQLSKQSPCNRILVTAGSNAACDEIASRLCTFFNETGWLHLLRIYAVSFEKRIENIDEKILKASNLCDGQHFYPSLDTIYKYPIIICTLSVVGKLVHGNIKKGHFTHIFIDECGASTEAESLLGLASVISPSGHLIVSGDPKQLGPIIKNVQADNYGLGCSLLERLMKRDCYRVDSVTKSYNKAIQARLVRNFRNHKKILDLPNKLFYDDELKAEAPIEITNWALEWPKLNKCNFPIVWKTARGPMKRPENSTSLYNNEELREVMACVKEMKFFGINGRKISDDDIGIISPYKMQCQLIRKELDRRGWYQIATGSVETFQGQEKAIIIASTVRSNTSSPGFLNSPKRLNVLLTRAQALLVIIGNPETMMKIGDWESVIQYCVDNNAFIDRKPEVVAVQKQVNRGTQNVIQKVKNNAQERNRKDIDVNVMLKDLPKCPIEKSSNSTLPSAPIISPLKDSRNIQIEETLSSDVSRITKAFNDLHLTRPNRLLITKNTLPNLKMQFPLDYKRIIETARIPHKSEMHQIESACRNSSFTPVQSSNRDLQLNNANFNRSIENQYQSSAHSAALTTQIDIRSLSSTEVASPIVFNNRLSVCLDFKSHNTHKCEKSRQCSIL